MVPEIFLTSPTPERVSLRLRQTRKTHGQVQQVAQVQQAVHKVSGGMCMHFVDEKGETLKRAGLQIGTHLRVWPGH
jgi:hypothetical protein